jgi:hypothetical protein
MFNLSLTGFKYIHRNNRQKLTALVEINDLIKGKLTINH